MRLRLGRLVSLALVLLAVPAAPLHASPQDSKAGDTRVTYSKQGTVLRADAAVGGAAVATLPARTSVSVLEVKLPWIRVSAVAAAGQAPVTGWIRAYETVEPEALAAPAPPPHLTGADAGPVSERDAAAAGRQFDSETERGYRASRADLAQAYVLVDRMEAETAAMDPAEEIGFVMDGSIGRRGRDALRPRRLTPAEAGPVEAPEPPPEEPRGGGGGGIPGGLGGLLGKVGGKHGSDLAKVGKVLDIAAKIANPALRSRYQQMSRAFTPGQEYFLGRAVAASAIAKYGVDRSEARRRYVRMVGDAVVRMTNLLEPPAVPQVNYGGYHFEVLDSDEVNGISGPGGFVLVTRGAVEACRTEDELAGILAHELSHIRLKHGELAVRESEKGKASMKNAGEALGALGGAVGLGDAGVGRVFVQLFSEFAGHVATVAVDHSYSPQLEFQADQDGTQILYDVLYDHTALRSFLVALSQGPNAHGGSATHAAPEVRASALDGVVASLGPYAPRPGVTETRLARFQASLGRAPAAGPR